MLFKNDSLENFSKESFHERVFHVLMEAVCISNGGGRASFLSGGGGAWGVSIFECGFPKK